MKAQITLVLALFLANAQAIRHHRVSDESQDIINGAINDVLHISRAPEPYDSVVHTSTNIHHHHEPQAIHHVHHRDHTVIERRVVPVTKYIPVPGPTVEKTVVVNKEVPVVIKPATLPHSSVMRAVADANERQAA